MKKRMFAAILAVLMVIPFAGCRKKGDDGDNSSTEYEYEYIYEDASGNTDGAANGETQGTSTTGSNKNSGNNNLEGNTYLSGFPVVKKKETISIMAVTRSDLGDIAKSDFTKTYSQMTNMDIDWQLVTEGETDQRRILALQSGDMPDVFAVTMTDAEMLQYSSEGAFVEITKSMLKKWAPNIYSTYEKYPEAWNTVTDSTGKMHSIAGFTQDFPYGQHLVWVRKTWLSKLGISTPQTMDEFYNMLVAFKNQDPNGNGQQDEIPYAMWSHDGCFFNGWGFDSTISVSNSGKVTHMYTTDNMKRALTYWNKIYKEDLADKKTIDNWAGTNAAFKTLISGGKVGAFYYGWPSEALKDDLLAEYEPLVWPTAGNNGDFPSTYISTSEFISPANFVITKSCKNVSSALRFLDYLYTNDGYMLKQYGDEGGYYTKASDNTYSATGKAAAKNPGPAWSMRGKNFLDGATFNIPETLQTQLRNQLNNTFSGIASASGQKNMPNILKNKDEINQIKLYSTYFDGIDSKWWSFVRGDLSLNSDWTALQNEMSSKGLNKYISALQSYYDRANK